MDDAVDDDDERAGRAADLETRSTKSGDQKASDDGSNESCLRRCTRCDSNGHCQRQCHDRDSEPGYRVVAKERPAVTLLTQHRD